MSRNQELDIDTGIVRAVTIKAEIDWAGLKEAVRKIAQEVQAANPGKSALEISAALDAALQREFGLSGEAQP